LRKILRKSKNSSEACQEFWNQMHTQILEFNAFPRSAPKLATKCELAAKKGAARRSVSPEITFFHHDVFRDNLVPVDPPESAKEIGALPWLGLHGRRRRGQQGDDDAAFADTNPLTRFHPIQDTSSDSSIGSKADGRAGRAAAWR
jgi:hypothetical protein